MVPLGGTRIPSGSVPGTAFPFVRYPGFGPLDAWGRLGSHTPRIVDAKSESRCVRYR